MKKLSFLTAFTIIGLISYSQVNQINKYPNFQQFGSPTTWTRINGAMYAWSGIVNAEYTDTTSANLSSIKLAPGAQIRVGDKIYLRNSTATGWIEIGAGVGGTVTSVGLSMPSAFTVTNSPITSSGTIAVTGAGTSSQIIKGDGSLGSGQRFGYPTEDVTIGVNRAFRITSGTFFHLYNSSGSVFSNGRFEIGGSGTDNLDFEISTGLKGATDAITEIFIEGISGFTAESRVETGNFIVSTLAANSAYAGIDYQNDNDNVAADLTLSSNYSEMSHQKRVALFWNNNGSLTGPWVNLDFVNHVNKFGRDIESHLETRVDSLTLALRVAGTSKLLIQNLSNVTTQDRLLGIVNSTGQVGNLTLGTGLSLASGVLSSTVTSGFTTADNGLTASSATNVQLGGSLTANTTIAAGAFTLDITGTAEAFQVHTTTVGNAGIIQNNGAGNGVFAITQAGIGVIGQSNYSSTNDAQEVFRMNRLTGTAANGIGGAFNFNVENSTGNAVLANQLIGKWTDVTSGTRTSQFDIMGVNSTALETFSNFQTGGIVRVNNLADTLATKAYARSVGGSGGSQTPWTSDIDGENNDLADVATIGIGVTSASAKLHVQGTTEQYRLGYDASNYWKHTVASNGNLTIEADDTENSLIILNRQTDYGSIPINLGSSGSGYPGISYNVAYQSTNGDYNYRTTDAAYMIHMGASGNDMRFKVAASGTGGTAISWTDVMLISSSGYAQTMGDTYLATSSGGVGIGTVSPGAYKLLVSGTFGVTGVADFGTTINTTTTNAVQIQYTNNSSGFEEKYTGTATTNSYSETTDGWFINTNGGPIIFGSGGSGDEDVRVHTGGSVGIGVTPTAYLHIKAGTASANTAPIKFTTGTDLSANEAGVMQYNGRFSLTKVNDVKFGVGGSLVTNTTDVGNVTTGVDNLMTYSIPAGTLSTDGDYVEFTMTITFAANANSKQVTVVYGGTTVYTSGAQVQNGGSMQIKGTIIRTGATTQKITFNQNNNTTLFADYADYVAASETLSGAVTLKATGEGVSTDDIVQRILIVKYFPSN